MVPDVIERQLVLMASRETVWAALTQADKISQWFSARAEIDLRPGGKLGLYWPDNEYSDHGYGGDGRVEVVEPMTRFAFTWRPFAYLRRDRASIDPSLRLRVEFTLEDHPRGVRLTMRESGFSKLPDALRSNSFLDNELGWTEELAELVTHVKGVSGS